MKLKALKFTRPTWGQQSARDWAEANGYFAGNVEDNDSILLPQATPSEFAEGMDSEQPVAGVQGVWFVYGQPKETRQDGSQTVRRYDAFPDLGKAEILENGFLRCPATFARAGVLRYIEGQREVFELIPPEEIFSPETLSSFAQVPLTDEHPYEGEVTAANFTTVSKGYTGARVVKAGNEMQGTVTIGDKLLVDEVQEGKRELSIGRDCVIDETPGLWNGQHYDRVQRRIRGNHVAVVTKGRAGAVASLRLDDAHTQTEGPMNKKKITLDGKEYELEEGVVDAINAHVGKVKGECDSTANASLSGIMDAAAFTGAETKAEEEAEAAQAVATEAADKRTDSAKIIKVLGIQAGRMNALRAALLKERDPKAQAEKIQARQDAMDKAIAVLGTEEADKLKGASLAEIKKAVVVAANPSLQARCDSASVDFIEGLFAAVHSQRTDSDDLGTAIERAVLSADKETRTDSKDAKRVDAHAEALKKQNERWKQTPQGALSKS